MKELFKKQKKLLWLSLCLLLTLAALVCLWRIHGLKSALSAQQAAERWQGESEQSFTQVSCFVPVDEALSQNQIYAFRGKMLQELNKAALDGEGSDGLWRDAWSAVGKVRVSSEKGAGDASVIAVGGDFFSFHPLKLLSGDYLREDDLMHDRVLLDLDLAWLLFGGTDLQGMEMKINDRIFLVAGVVERETDDASRRNLIGQDTVNTLDEYFVGIEHSVAIVANRAMDSLDSVTLVECAAAGGYAAHEERTSGQAERLETYLEAYFTQVQDTFESIASHTLGCVTYYFCVNPQMKTTGQGFYYSRVGKAGFVEQRPFSDKDLEKKEQNFWYYTSLERGRPSWIGPYQADILDGMWICS